MTGAPTDEARIAGSPAQPPPAAVEELGLVVPLYHARWRHFVWAMILCGIGVLFLVSFGSIGRTVGALLFLLGLWPALEFGRTLAHTAGAIGVSAAGVALPPRVCAGTRTEVPFGDVKHAYFLRRVLPWMTTGPLLIVETVRGTFAYPRDWFASEADQRKVATSINRRAIGRRAG